MASINVTDQTHSEIRYFARKLLAEDIDTNIGDVTDQMWCFVSTRHKDAFDAFVRENVASR